MIADHQGTSAQLSFGGRRLNLLPSATLLPAHQALFDELSASGDFDATYRRQQIAVHQSGGEAAQRFRGARRKPDPADGRAQRRAGRAPAPRHAAAAVMRAWLLLLAAAAGLSAAARRWQPSPYLSGQWGGPHISLLLEGGLGTIEYDCASGTIDTA